MLPTPFNTDESIDKDGFERILSFAKAAGCTSVCVPAFGSEFYKLSGDERAMILDIVFKHRQGLDIIVQCNHSSPLVVRSLVRDAEARGAAAINTALPRALPASTEQLFAYAAAVCSSTSLPVIIQDYNPGGAIIDADFAKRLSDKFENFGFIKYEVPGIGQMIQDIAVLTQGKVKIFTGWGGLYLPEQFPAGIAGVMPGIPLSDYFVKLLKYAIAGNMSEVIKMFSGIAPYLMFSLQHLEMFHHAEKRLAVRRNIMSSAVVRSVSAGPDSLQDKYLELLLDHTCNVIEQAGLQLKMGGV